MADTQTVNIDIPVGDGPVTKSNKVLQWFAAFGGFSGIAVFLVGVADLLPDTVDPSWGLALTTASGVIAALGNFFTGKNRGQFAEAKARIIESAYYAPNVPVGQVPLPAGAGVGEAEVAATVGGAGDGFVFDTEPPTGDEVEEALLPTDYNGPVTEPQD